MVKGLKMFFFGPKSTRPPLFGISSGKHLADKKICKIVFETLPKKEEGRNE